MKKIILVLFVSFLPCVVFSQKFDYGKVSKEELLEKSHPIDTEAAAAVLYNKAKTSFVYSKKDGFAVQTEFEIRIKIYKKEGLDWANFEVPYYVGWENLKDDTVKFSDCNTYNIVNGKVEKTKLSGEGTFKEVINSYWKKRSITMPDVKEGSVIEIKYVLKSENIITLPEFNFQYSIPVNFSQYVTEVPVYYVYNVILRGYLTVSSDSKIEFRTQPFEDDFQRTSNIDFKVVKATHTVYNVPALVKEEYVDNINNYKSRLEQELKLIRYPDEPEKNLAATWEGVAKEIYKVDSFGKELSTRNYFETEVKGKITEPDIDKNRMQEILNYVQNRMNWNEREGYFTDKGVKKAFVERTGNVAEINFILITLLNYSGFNASPVLLSTRDNGISAFPSRTALNYVVAGVEFEDNLYLLDATSKYSQINVLPIRTLNGTGRLIKSDGTVTDVLLNPKNFSRSNEIIAAEISSEGKIKGQYKSNQTDYYAYLFRNNYATLTADSHLERLEKEYSSVEFLNYTVENEKDLSKPIVENFNFEDSNSSEIIGDKLYVNPFLFLTPGSNPFLKENRACPINFGFPFQEKTTITLTIPDGYEVEYIPKQLNLALENNLGGYKYLIQNTGNKLQLVATTEILKPEIGLNYYDSFRIFYKTVFEKQLEKIILKKK
jgi:hypothetical protein